MSKTKSMWNRGDALLLSDNLQERNFGRIFYEFTNLALNRFKWENLPKGLESRHIEKALFEYGQCAFVDDPELGILCLGCSNTNGYNPYGDPTHVVLHGVGYSKNFALSEVERILNNDTLLPTKFHVEYYTNKIYEIDKAIYKNLKQQKRPYIIATTKDNQLTMKNIIKQVKEDVEEIYVDERITNGEDMLFNIQYLTGLTESIILLNDCTYHYTWDKNISLSSTVTENHLTQCRLLFRLAEISIAEIGTLSVENRKRFYTDFYNQFQRVLLFCLQNKEKNLYKRLKEGNLIMKSPEYQICANNAVISTNKIFTFVCKMKSCYALWFFMKLRT